MGVPLSIFNGFLIQFYDYTGQRNENFFFLYWYETSPFCTILGRWFRTRHPFFAITSKFRSIANFMVGRSENQFFTFCEKTIRDIENLITFRRFRIKFCAFTKKINQKSVQPFLRYRWLRSTKAIKMTLFDNFFYF